jgi:GNAT superfamily N-acetyltransferase
VVFTRERDETIRQCEITGIRNAVATAGRLRPSLGAAAIEVCGGLVPFTGVESPMSQAIGVGTPGPATRDDVERIVEFYVIRRTTPRVFVTPLAHPTLGRELAAAGFAPCEYENVIACDDFRPHARRDDRVAVATDARAWAHASARAFMHPETPKENDEFVALIIASSPGVTLLEIRHDDRIVATAAMDLQFGCAGLFAGSVDAAFRGRGLHAALLRDRLARALEGGAAMVRATARPAGLSERNFARLGFTALYTRTLWERARTKTHDSSGRL